MKITVENSKIGKFVQILGVTDITENLEYGSPILSVIVDNIDKSIDTIYEELDFVIDKITVSESVNTNGGIVDNEVTSYDKYHKLYLASINIGGNYKAASGKSTTYVFV